MPHPVAPSLLLALAAPGAHGQDSASDWAELAFCKLVGDTWQVFLADAEGTHVVQLTDAESDRRSPAWSADGEHLFYCDGEGRLYVDPLDGSEAEELLPAQAPLAAPALSREGEIAYSRVRRASGYQLEVWASDVAGFALRRLTSPGMRQQEPAWSPDGKRLAVGQYDPREELFSLVVMDDLGGSVERLVRSEDRVGDPAWTPDGASILYVAHEGGNYDLYAIDVESRRTQQLTSDPAADRNPTVSPDGSTVIFTSRRSGETMLWRMPISGGEAQPLEACRHPCREPAWRPSGARELPADALRLGQRTIAPGEALEVLVADGAELAEPKLEVRCADGSPVSCPPLGTGDDGAMVWRLPQEDDLASGVYYVAVGGIREGNSRVWDPTRATGGETCTPSGMALDPNRRVLRFELSEPCWIRVRVGAEDGLLFGTPVAWTAFGAGAHEIPIPGGLPDPWGSVWHQPGLRARIDAITLPANALIVAAPDAEPPCLLGEALVVDPPDARSLALRADPPVVCAIVGEADGASEGSRVVGDVAHLRVDARNANERAFFEESRFEVVVYLDGQFLMEDEDSVLPFNYRLDVSRFSAGEHSFLVNVVSDLGPIGVGFGSFVIQ